MAKIHPFLLLLVLSSLVLFPPNKASSCTIAVASGTVTMDGRPLLWKNRDINNANLANQEVRYFNDGNFGGYLCLVTTGYHDETTSYVGINDAGFSIMNSLSPDLHTGSPSSHGILMKLALRECESVDDFENLLITTAGNRGYTWANFGVIDRFGGAAIFEAIDDDYRRYDAEDEGGYIVRANNSVWGGGDLGSRFFRANLLVGSAVAVGQLGYRHLIQNIAKDLGEPPSMPCGQWPTIEPAINRHQTRSSVVVHGVLPSEDPRLSTFWCTLGEPSCGISVPMWSSSGTPSSLLFNPGQQALLCGAIQEKELYCYDNLTSDSSINTDVLVGPDGSSGIQGYSLPIENDAFLQTETRLGIWRQTGPSDLEISQYQAERSSRSHYYFGQEISPEPTTVVPVTDISLTPGYDKITLAWTDPGTGFSRIEVWRTRWNDDSGASVYPVYQNHPTGIYPSALADRTGAQTDRQWELVGEVEPGGESYIDDVATRGVYFYQLFVIDAGFNSSPAWAVCPSATNYWLGDVSDGVYGQGDGLVNVADFSQLGSTYGTDFPSQGFLDECDVAPTDDWSSLGIPQPDGVIDFEDLMIFSLNFGFAGPDKSETLPASTLTLAWVTLPSGELALHLTKPCPAMKGLRLTSRQRINLSEPVAAGELLINQTASFFLRNSGRSNELDIGLVIMGNMAGLIGRGKLLRLPGALRPKDITIEARDLFNRNIVVELNDSGSPAVVPSTLTLVGNYPNPFNPRTVIEYGLPTAGKVLVEISTLSGRHVVTLIDKPQSAGAHRAIWNGCNSQGRPAASGIYLYRVHAGTEEKSGRMCLVR